MRPRQDSAIRIRAVAAVLQNDSLKEKSSRPLEKRNFVSRCPFCRRISRCASALFGTAGTNFIQLLSPALPPPPFGRQVDAARCTRSLSSQPLSLSASPAIFAIAINALDSPARQLLPFQLHHRRRLCTLFRRIGMKDQRPNNGAPRDHLLLLRHRHRHHRLFRPVVLSRRGSCTSSSHLTVCRRRRRASPFCFSCLSRACRL